MECFRRAVQRAQEMVIQLRFLLPNNRAWHYAGAPPTLLSDRALHDLLARHVAEEATGHCLAAADAFLDAPQRRIAHPTALVVEVLRANDGRAWPAQL